MDVELTVALHEVNKANYEKEVESLLSKMNKKGKSAAVFELKERILGSKMASMEAVVLEDPETGCVVDSPEEIKAVSLAYCTNLLTNRMPTKGYEGITQYK